MLAIGITQDTGLPNIERLLLPGTAINTDDAKIPPESEHHINYMDTSMIFERGGHRQNNC